MPSTFEALENNKAKITLNVSPEKLEEGLSHSYSKLKNQINLPGFRKGKAPRRLIEIQYGVGIFYEDAVDFILPQLYSEALDEHKLDPVSKPDIDITAIEAGRGATITCEIYLRPEAKVMDYKGLPYKPMDASVSEEEIQAEIDKAREKNARIISVTDRPLEMGDIAVIDFEGFIDGVPFEGGKAENHELLLGSGQFIDNFEEQLAGAVLGEEREVNVIFPADYNAENLAGKPAIFKCRIHEIKHKELPETDDDLAQDVSEFETLEEYKSNIKAKLEHDKKHQAEHDKENQIIDALIDRTIVDVPEPMIESQIDNMVADFESRIKSAGIPFETYLGYMGMDIDGLRRNYRSTAERNVKARLSLEAVARLENYEPTEEDLDKELQIMAEQYEMDLGKLKEVMRDSDREGIIKDIKVQRALKTVVENSAEKTGETEKPE